jgi:signal recognition particle subunit SEC65
LKCRIDPEQSTSRRGREMIDLLAVEEPKPAKIRAVSYEAGIEQLFRRMRSFNEPNHRTSPSGRYCQPKQLEHRTYSSLCAAFAPQCLAVYSDENEQ